MLIVCKRQVETETNINIPTENNHHSTEEFQIDLIIETLKKAENKSSIILLP